MKITSLRKAAPALALIWATLAAPAATLTVFAAASLTDSLQEIGHDYEARTGDKIVFNFAASGVLERQIEEGAPADVFFSADESRMDALEKKGIIDKQTRRDRLSNSLVIIVPVNSAIAIQSPEDLKSDQVKHIALGDPQSVPAGAYAREYLRKVHLWDDLAPKVVGAANVRAALAFVESGDAEAGIVYKTDAAASKKARVACEVPREAGPDIRYPMAVVRESKEAGAARSFLEYLDSNAAGRVFEKYSFTLAEHKP